MLGRSFRSRVVDSSSHQPPPLTEARTIAPTAASNRTGVWGLCTRRERWGLSARGWVVLATLISLGAYTCVANLNGFLAVTERVDSDTLVVEGWIHQYATQLAVEEYWHGKYRLLFTTGGPVVGKGGYINDYNTSASVGADLLKKAGIPRDRIQMVPSRVNDRDRTYSSAVALRNWLREHSVQVRSVNVVTEGAHARRTRLLFQKALGPDVTVGIISLRDPDYDAKRWWRYSDGVREVIGEAIAYIYAKLFFYQPGGSLPLDTKLAICSSQTRRDSSCLL